MKMLLIALAAAALAVPAAQAADDRVVSPDDHSIAPASSPGLLSPIASPDAAAPPSGAYIIEGEVDGVWYDLGLGCGFRCIPSPSVGDNGTLSLKATTALGGSGTVVYRKNAPLTDTVAIALDCVAVRGSSVWATGTTATGSTYAISMHNWPVLYVPPHVDVRVLSVLGDGPCDSPVWESTQLSPHYGYLAVVLAGQNAPPKVSFTSSCSGLTCTFDGRGSSDADAALTDFRWRFGEGSRASGRVVSHTYASPGTYSIRLMVRDDAGAVDWVDRQVTVG